jgi:DNA-directed RNA polymerase subunit RPC12/RpoP
MTRTMPRSRKINLEKVQASLDAACPKCGRMIPPADVRRIDFDRIECPMCGERFVPGPINS